MPCTRIYEDALGFILLEEVHAGALVEDEVERAPVPFATGFGTEAIVREIHDLTSDGKLTDRPGDLIPHAACLQRANVQGPLHIGYQVGVNHNLDPIAQPAGHDIERGRQIRNPGGLAGVVDQIRVDVIVYCDPILTG